VPENLIFTNKEIAFLRELKRQKVEFMLVGAALQGAPVVTQDVDLWFKDVKDPGILTALRKSSGTRTMTGADFIILLSSSTEKIRTGRRPFYMRAA